MKKHFAKFALTAMLLAGTAAAVTATPAEARVSIGIGIGGGYYGGPYYGPGYYGPAPYCDRYSRYYDPYRCNAAYDDSYYDDYYDDPIFFDGAWLSGPYRYRYYGGHPQFFINGGWQSNVRFGSGGFHPGGHGSYHGGGGFHGGGGGSFHGGGHGGGGFHHH
jgi:hypothetical protein